MTGSQDLRAAGERFLLEHLDRRLRPRAVLQPPGNFRRCLLEAARIGDIVFDPTDRALWGLRTKNGLVTLVRIPYPYDNWETLHVFEYGEVPFDLDLSRDGELLSMSLAGPDASRKLTQVMQVRVLRTEAARAGDVTPLRQF